MYIFQFVFVFSCLSFTLQEQLPTFFKKCKIDDKNCLIDTIEKGVASIAEGYQEFGIDEIDPFYVNEVVLEPTSGPISIYQKYTNTICRSHSKLKVTSIDINLEPCSIAFKLMCPKIYLTTDYVLKGTFFQIQIDANDKLNSTVTNGTADILCKCEKYKKGDEEHIRIIESTSSTNFKNIVINLGEVIVGNDVFNKNFNDLVNENPEGFVELSKGVTDYHFGLLSMTVANKIFDRVPLKDLFEN